MYLREISGAEDAVMYLPYKDDKHERAAKTRSEACSDNFRHPKLTLYRREIRAQSARAMRFDCATAYRCFAQDDRGGGFVQKNDFISIKLFSCVSRVILKYLT